MKILKLTDKTYKLADFDKDMMAALVAWAKPKLPDPMAEVKESLKDFSPKLQEVMVREAMRVKRLPKTIESDDIQALLRTPEGLEQVILLTFTRFQPDLKADDIWKIHFQAVKELGEDYTSELPEE
jgi:hypothetical protein